MRHFAFLFLFHFTLSESIYFKITKQPGLHLWNIPVNEYKNPHYKKINLARSSKVNVSESIHPHSDITSSSNEQTRTSILKTNNTYVILHITRRNEFYLYYWIGARSSLEKRRNAAYSAAFILNQIHTEMLEVELTKFHREAEGVESEKFSNLFNLPVKRQPKMYRVAGSKGQFIIPVPLMYNELNGSDSFVLDRNHAIFNWNSLHSNVHKINRAKSWANDILQRVRRTRYLQDRSTVFIWMTEGNPHNTEQKYFTFKRRFLQKMTGVPESQELPQTPLNYTDEDLANKRREKLKLYAYYRLSNVHYAVERQEIPWTVLTLDIFEENNAYVLVDSSNGYVFAFLGKSADTEQLKKALYEAEMFSMTAEVENAWQMVKVFRQGQPLPTYVLVYFDDEALKI